MGCGGDEVRLRRSELLVLLGLLLALSLPVAAQDELQAGELDSLRQVYDYDATAPLEPDEAEPEDAGAWTSQAVRYNGAEGSRVPGVLLSPKDVDRPPCVLFLHGYGGSKEQAQLVAALLVPHGIAVFAIDAVMHGERAEPGKELFSAELVQGGRPIVRTVIDNRRAIDYLESREDIGAEHQAILGVSMGGILGSILAAVEPRIDAAALIVAGGRWDLLLANSAHPSAQKLSNLDIRSELIQRAMRAVEPVNFVGHIAPRPVLMVNGEQDQVIPRVCAEALHEAANEPKQVIWYEDGHIGVPPDVIGEVTEWVTQQCGVPVAQPAG